MRCDAHPDLPTVILRGSHMTAHREMRFLIVAEDHHAEIASRIVHDVIDPEGEVEQLAAIGFEATGNTQELGRGARAGARGDAPRGARDPAGGAAMSWTPKDMAIRAEEDKR